MTGEMVLFVFDAVAAVGWALFAFWAVRTLYPTSGPLAFMAGWGMGYQAFSAAGYALEFFA